jgi:hypothetical protein
VVDDLAMAVHRVDEGSGIYFQATVTFEDERVRPNTDADVES